MPGIGSGSPVGCIILYSTENVVKIEQSPLTSQKISILWRSEPSPMSVPIV